MEDLMTRDPEKAKEKMDDLYKDRALERATLKVLPLSYAW